MATDASALLDHPVVVAALFHPQPDPPGFEEPENGMRLVFSTQDDAEFSVRCHLAAAQDPHVLFFHGNGELASDYDTLALIFVEHQLSLLVCDYRGYGMNPGIPTGTRLLSDALDAFNAVLQWLKEQNRSGPLYVMGRSLGTAATLEIAARHEDQLAGILFDSAFADTLPLLARLGVPLEHYDFKEENGFRQREKMANFHKPVLFLHGQRDILTPLHEAQTLHALCPAKKRHLIVIPGAGHNDTFAKAGPLYFQSIEMFTGHKRQRSYSRRSR